jgi:hypothetical protein
MQECKLLICPGIRVYWTISPSNTVKDKVSMEIISWEFGGACIPVVVHEGVIYAEHNQVAGGLKLDPSNLIHMATRNPKRFSVLNGSPEPVKKFFSANREVFGKEKN